ncbi:MAG: LptF/LptG family permease [Thermoguttaceae bacterium]
MGSINRYILREFIKTCIFALLIFTGLLVLVMVLREAISRGIPLGMALRFVPYILPEQLRYSLPITLLLASTTVFARMGGANEITALKALGIPPWKILWPVFLIAFLVSLLTVWINDFALSYGKAGISRVLLARAEEYIFTNLRTNQKLEPGSGFKLTVKGIENKRLLSPTITIKNQSISAQWAEIELEPQKEECKVTLYNLSAGDLDGAKLRTDKYEHILSLSSLVPRSNDKKSASEMLMSDIPNEIDKQLQLRRSAINKVAAEAAFAVCLGDFDEFSSESWTGYSERDENIQNQLNRLRLEFPRRWASGFSCFFFVWVGAPLGIWLKKSDIFASFFACFVPILIFYYPLLEFGLQGAKSGNTPPSLVWIGNICLGIIGFVILKKIHRY